MFNTGISKFELLMMLPGLRGRLKKALKNGTLDVAEGLDTVSWTTWKFSKAAKEPYKEFFLTLTRAVDCTSDLITLKEEEMKFELGITVGEITAMLPTVLSEAWEHYSDDKKITVDEAVDLVSVILGELAEAADDDNVQAFFAAQAEALIALIPLLGVDDEEPPVDPPADPE